MFKTDTHGAVATTPRNGRVVIADPKTESIEIIVHSKEEKTSQKSIARRPSVYYKRSFSDLSKEPAIFVIPELYRTPGIKKWARKLAKKLHIIFDKEHCALICTTRRGVMRAYGHHIFDGANLPKAQQVHMVGRTVFGAGDMVFLGHRISTTDASQVVWKNANPYSLL